MRLRLISAVVLAPLGLTSLWLGAGAWVALVAVTAFGLAIEWVQLCGRPTRTAAGLAVPLAILTAAAVAVGAAAWIALLVLAGAGGLIVLVAAKTGIRRAPLSLAAGVPYVGLAVVALIWLRSDPSAGFVNVLFLLLIVWASDIGAYAAGRLIGGRLLAPSVSPGKTWAGAAGGLLAAALTGLLLAWALLGPSSGVRPAVVAAGLGVVAQLGDLLESLIKRGFGVKDSGTLIPGHGGLFDRLDGLLAVAPVAALLALLLGRGVILWA